MKKALSVICLAAITFIACKKDKNDPDPEPEPQPVNVIAYWEGKYVDTKNGNKEGYFGVLLRADSTARIYVEDPGVTVTDTSKVTSRTETTFTHQSDAKKLTFTYHTEAYPAINLATSGTVNDAANGIAGTWGNSPSASDRGTYTVTKK